MIICFLPDHAVTQLCHALYTWTVLCRVDLGTSHYFEMAPNVFPNLFKSIMDSFRSMLSSLDTTFVVFVSESNGCIKQTLIKWALESHQLLTARRGKEAMLQRTFYSVFYNHLNWSLKLMYVYFWAFRFGHIFRRPIINSDLNQTSCVSLRQSNMYSTHSMFFSVCKLFK